LTKTGRRRPRISGVAQADTRRRRFRPGFALTSVSPSPSKRPSLERSSSFRTGRPLVRSTGRVGKPSRSPQNSSLHCRSATAPLRGQHVLLIGAAVGGGRRLQDALVHERAQPYRQDVLGEPDVLLKFAEAANPQQGVADDQQRPPVADGIERSRDRGAEIFIDPGATGSPAGAPVYRG
jgi:hypothetical protein